MSAPAPTRRGILRLVAAAPIATTACVAGTPATVAASSDLSRLIAVAKAARARREAFWDDVMEPAEIAHEAARDAIRHVTVEGAIPSIAGSHIDFTTAKPGVVAVCRRVLSDPPGSWEDADYLAACRRLVAADDAREAEKARLRRAHRLDEIATEDDRLATVTWECERAAIDLPVSTIGDLCRKVEYIEAADFEHDATSWAAVAADVRRIAGRTA